MKKRVLVVDDDPTILESIQYLLEDEGYQVVTSTDGKLLHKKLLEKKPDLILLDYWLPLQNGGELAKVLKGKKETQYIPIVMISASHDIKKIAKEVGAEDFLAKPYDIDELLILVKKYTHLVN